MGSVHSVSLNEAIVMSGGCTSGERKMVVGGWVWAWWMISDVQVIVSTLTSLYVFRSAINGHRTKLCLI